MKPSIAQVQAEAHYYWWVRIVMMPLVLINMSLSGILQGFRQMKAVAAINSGQALLEMAGSALVLTGYLGIDPANGLFCMGLCSLITQVLQLFVGMAAVLFLPPPEAHGQYSLMRELFGDKPDDSGALSEPLMSSLEPEVANHNDSASGHVNGVKHLDKVYGNGSAKDEEISRDVVSSTLAPQTPGASTAALDASISAAQTDTDYELDPENEPESLFSFVSDGLNMFVRSMILQTTFFTALVAASRLGTPSLAAHCIVNQLWQLISYAVDGFAAAGIVLGSRLAAQAHDPHLAADARVHLKRIIFRVLNAGLLFGLAAGLVFGIFRRRVIGMFTSDVATIQVLSGGVWGILCLSQPLNGLVFVYDGLMYASQSFTFIRNYISLGFLVVFCPILAVHAVVGETLAGVWLANAAFNAWRVAGAAYLIHWIFMDEFDALSVRGASTQSLLLDADVDEEVGTVRR
jgi:Na+-driven multidrug efflux pump